MTQPPFKRKLSPSVKPIGVALCNLRSVASMVLKCDEVRALSY